ncbi:MAG: extracellular solute-binding protein [Clostridia bacterium]|nr:extracellular solute-binding protein [Clostridia bacterium]
MKKLLCMVMAIAMLLSGAALAEGLTYASDGLFVFNPSYDYMETDCNSWPLVKEGEEITLSVLCYTDDAYPTPPYDVFFWNWLTAETGIKFEVEQVLQSALNERKSLMFASAELPDILLCVGLSTTDMMNYGAGEGLLLDFTPYVTPELMPNLCLALEEFPIMKANATAADGKMYSLPYNRGYFSPYGESDRIFIDKNRMEEVGVAEPPKTLDEFIDMLYAFKEADPDCIPLGGANDSMNPGYYILNAMGFLGQDGNYGTTITVRDGEAVLPVGDPLFKEYLTIMHQLYEDGILAESFFTDKGTEVNAKMSEGKLGVYPFVPFTVTPNVEDFSHWTSITPLTSEWSDKQQWLEYNCWDIGGFAASAKTQYPEIIARLADFFYSDYGFVMIWDGAYANNNTMGIIKGQEVWLEWDNLRSDGLPNIASKHPEIIDGTYDGDYDFKYSIYGGPFSTVGLNGGHVATSRATGIPEGIYAERHDAFLLRGLGWRSEEDFNYYVEHYMEYKTNPPTFDVNSPEGQFRGSMYEYVTPYETSGFPAITYYTLEETEAISNYRATLKTYADGEIAKFISGDRAIDEYEVFVEELEGMGLREWEQIYKDAWENYVAAMG